MSAVLGAPPLSIKRTLLRNSRHFTKLAFVVWIVGAAGAMFGAWRLHPLTLGAMAALAGGVIVLHIWARWQREVALREAPLPQFLKRKLRETYPHLSGKDCDLVERGLRQYFLACLRSDKKFVAMPSKVVDAMWHEFILHTRAYREWCELTLGWFLHHTPAEALGPKAIGNDGLRRAWYWACRDESIQPKNPTRLPLLFALDHKLGIPGGFHYQPNCHDINRKSAAGGDGSTTYCGTDFSSDSFSGDASGLGGADSPSGSWGDGGSTGCGGDGGGDGGGEGGGGSGGGGD